MVSFSVLFVTLSLVAISSNYIKILGNGYIPTSSLREILAALDEQLTPDQLNEMIAEIDTDSSGTVDFEGTFLSFFFKNT